MTTKEEDAKVVVDLTGLDGFQGQSCSKEATIEQIGMDDFVDDDVPFEEILQRIQKQPVVVVDKELNIGDQTEIAKPILDLGYHQYPSIWAQNWRNSRPDHFARIYPNVDEELSADILSRTIESLELLRDAVLLRIEDSDDDDLPIHAFYLEFIESAILMKGKLNQDNERIGNTSDITLSKPLSPKRRLVIESDSDEDLEADSRTTACMPVPIEPQILEMGVHKESYTVMQVDSTAVGKELQVSDAAAHESKKEVSPSNIREDAIVIHSDSDSDEEEWEAIPVPNEVIVLDKNECATPEMVCEAMEEEFGTLYDPFSQSNQYTPTKQRRDSASSGGDLPHPVIQGNVDYIDVPVLLDQEVDEYYSDLRGTDLDLLRKQTHAEVVDLMQEYRSSMRDNAEVTPQMVTEIQELLKHFGIPFITAPMEAESQCAFLLLENLVDGIITDDSDVFLFGGTLVYKNLFDSKKYVERFTLEGIRELGLDRSQLVQMAFLLGSDYTTGIYGIGPVASVEIVTNWKADGLDGLIEFKDWVKALQDGVLGEEEQKRVPKKLLSQCRKLEFPDGFPDVRIYDAYMNPTVDASLTPFVWGELLLDPIREYLKAKLHWTIEKIDSVIIPVIKELRKQKKPRQTQLEDFFPLTPKMHKSVRVQNATRGGRNSKKKRNI
jgi:DNA excision repair protein ERCC-5